VDTAIAKCYKSPPIDKWTPLSIFLLTVKIDEAGLRFDAICRSYHLRRKVAQSTPTTSQSIKSGQRLEGINIDCESEEI
jgi:hypothetical protein